MTSSNLLVAQLSDDTQHEVGGEEPSALQPIGASTPTLASVEVQHLDPDQPAYATHATLVGVEPSPAARPRSVTSPTDESGVRQDPLPWGSLRAVAEVFHEAQQTRIAFSNRRRAFGDAYNPTMAIMADAYLAAEKAAKRQLTLAFRANAPRAIKDWEKTSNGIGIPTLCRLLGSIGHPSYKWEMINEGTGAERKAVLVGEGQSSEPSSRTCGSHRKTQSCLPQCRPTDS